MWRPVIGAPLAPLPNPVNARGLPALNMLRDPRNVGFPTGQYLVLLQHWSRLGWVHLWHMGKACMWTPRWGNILTLPTPVYYPSHERSYAGDTGTRGTGLSVTKPAKPSKAPATSSPSTPVGVVEAAELMGALSAATHFRSAMAAVQL